MAKFKKVLKNLFTFSEPEETEQFILKENEFDKSDKQSENEPKEEKGKKKECEPGFISKLFGLDSEKNENKESKKGKNSVTEKRTAISKKLSENLEHMKKVYSIPTNGDIKIREFDIAVKDKMIEAFIIFIDGMTDRSVINTDILQPLMLLSNLDIKAKREDIAEYVNSHLIPHNQLTMVSEYRKVIDEINFGGCGIFIDGIDVAFAADVKGWEHRGVERPNTELVIRGPQEGFNEVLRVNTALVRKILKDEDLIVESVEVGKKSKTPCSIMYIKDIANDSVVDELRRRLKSLKMDYIIDSGELEQMIEDSSFIPTPQVVATERPDRVAAALANGKTAVIMHGSPFALILPTTAYELIHSAEDSNIRFPFVNMLRIIRMVAILLSLLLPATYIAVTNFHHEMIPTDLLLAIEAARERVPFPSVVEIIIMEFSFELIREAGIRIPGPIGPTLGIIGALILGQAAVSANIVSPILIIIVAITGIGSFSIPNFSLAFAFRVLRFAYIILAALAGFLGITLGLFIHGLWLASAKSFGVPFLAPYGPKTAGAWGDELFRTPIWKQEERADYLNTKENRKQPKISRGWTKKQQGGKDEGK